MDLLRLFLVATLYLSVVSARYPKENAGKRALYFTTNDPAGSSIISLKISKDGKLSSPKLTPTGGKGTEILAPLMMIPGAPLAPHGPDPFFGQGAVEAYGNYLFVINAGSNTLSFFLIDEEDPSCVTLIGKPADTLGDFPMSVTYSSKLNTACVLNGGKVSGVTCFSVDSVTGLSVLDKSPRSISPPLNQTSPPVGPFVTTSDIVFNPSSTALFVAIKGGPMPVTPGYIYTWPVEYGKVSFEPTVTTFENLTGTFSIEFINEDDSTIFVSDVTVGAAILHVSPSPEFKITVKKYIPIPYNVATCWTSYSPITNAVYYTDALNPKVTVVNAKSESISHTIDFPSPAPLGTNFTAEMNPEYGGYDSAIDRTYLYFLAGTANVNVIDILTKITIQRIDLSAFGKRNSWVGMTIYS